jgi:4-methylaminobutanoate oxidase (formaldehyde-forming)
LIDQTSFAKFEITGPGALDAVQWLSVADMDKAVGTVINTQLCNPQGGIECDLTMTRLGEHHWYVVTGSAFGAHDMGWIRSNSPDDGSVQVRDLTSANAVINLCGPMARDVLQAVSDDDVSNDALRYATARHITVGAAPVLAMRIGYVGELGWGVACAHCIRGARLRTTAGRRTPARHRQRRLPRIDTLRMEKGYLYWSTDIHPTPARGKRASVGG